MFDRPAKTEGDGVTPVMIEAGATRVLDLCGGEIVSRFQAEDVAAEVFRAMLRASSFELRERR